MSFATYMNEQTYTDPMNVNILEPNPVVMTKEETSRYEQQYQPLLSQFLDRQSRMREDFEMNDRSFEFNAAFVLIAALGIFYVYTFVRMLMR